MIKSKSGGQMLVLVVLTMIVALTVGLSLAARTLVNVRLSKQNEESQRAFQAAEAGVEQIIQSGSNSSTDNLANSSSYQTSVTYPSGSNFLLNGSELVDQDVGIDVWIANYPDYSNPQSGTLTFYWSTPNQIACTKTTGVSSSQIKSAIEVIVLSGNKLLPTMEKKIFEATGTGCPRIANTSATSAGGTIANIQFQYSANISNITNGLILRIVPIFNSTKIAVSSANISLPKQGTIVSSTGKSGQTARKVQYFASYPQIPLEIFPYTIISQ